MDVEKVGVDYFSNLGAYMKQTKPTYCEACPLAARPRARDMPFEPDTPIDLMIVVDSPDYDDTQMCPEVFSARKWWLFVKVAKHFAEKNLITFKIFHACLCAPANEKKPTQKTVNYCRRFLLDKINTLKPKVIMALGTESYKALGFKQSVSKVRGNILPLVLKDHNAWVIPTYSVDQYFSWKTKLKMFSTFQLELEKAIHVTKNGYTSFDIETMGDKLSLYSDPIQVLPVLQDLTDRSDITLAFDIETFQEGTLQQDALDPFRPDSLVTILSLAWSATESLAIDVREAPDEFWDAARDLFGSSTRTIAHNGKFDIKWLSKKHSITFANFIGDTMLNHWLIDENRAGGAERSLSGEYTLKRLVWDYLPEYGGYEEYGGVAGLIQKGKFVGVDFDAAMTYAAMDTLVTWVLNQRQLRLMLDLPIDANVDQVAEEVAKNKSSAKMFVHCSRDLLPRATHAVVALESQGIYIDEPKRKEFLADADSRIKKLEKKFGEKINPDFTPSKSSDIIRLVHKDLGFPVTKKTKSGAPSTDEDALSELAGDVPIIQDILDWKKLTKLKSAFLDPLEALQIGGKVYPSYKLEGTLTGRLSCLKPNVQQTPKIVGVGPQNPVTERCPLEYNVKSLYIPRPGYTMIMADYSQIEVLVLACFSMDAPLIEAIEQGLDVHSYIASKMYGHEYDEFKARKEEPAFKAKRRQAKSVVFGTMYGSSAKGMAWKQGITIAEAQELIDTFNGICPGAGEYVNKTHYLAKKKHYVTTFFHRRRHFPVLQWYNHAASLRQAQNSPIQSSAADLTLEGVCGLVNELPKIGGAVLLTVHDSILAEVPDDPDTVEQAKEIYQRVLVEEPKDKFDWLVLPPKIDLDVGPNWGAV